MFWTVTLSLLEGMGVTIKLFCLTLLFALPLGLLISFGSMNSWMPFGFLRNNHCVTEKGFLRGLSMFTPIKWLIRAIIWVIRGTPLMLQLIVVYYGPGLLFGWDLLPRFIAALVAFVINYACYFSEIYRGGIESIPVGQKEAGQVLGMTKSQIFFKVTLLQVIKRIVPPMGNEIITLVKDTSLARIIAVYEVIWNGQAYIKSDGIIWPLFYTAVFYLIFNGVLTLLFGYIERKLSYFR